MTQEILNSEMLLCEQCATKLSKVFGISKTEIQNGGMKQIVWKVQLAEFTMKEAGIQFDQKTLVGEAMRSMNEVWKDKWREEIEKILSQKYEKEIAETEGTKKDNQEKDSKIKDLETQLKEYEAKERLQPSKIGDKLEDIVADALKRAFPLDEIVPEIKSKNEVDIKSMVKDGKNILGKVLVECKNTAKWNNSWIKTIKDHGERENTDWLIIATNVMPNEKFINPLGLEKEGVLITTPEKSIWAAAFMRQAILKTYSTINKLENERERLSKQAEAKQKLLKTIKSKDFEETFSACEEVQKEAQQVRNIISKAEREINSSTSSIEGAVKTIINTNSKLREAFDNLVE